MSRHALLIACTIALSQAWVQFPGAEPVHQYPWSEPTPRNLEIPPSEPTPTTTSISTIPSMTTIPIPTATDDSIPYHEQLLRWIKRQGPVVNPAPVQPAGFTQVSPITVLSMYSKGVQIAVPYTQTFAAVPEQWPNPSSGAIGLGTIQGGVGQSKTKRQLPQDAIVTIQTAVPEIERRPQDDEETDKDSDSSIEDLRIFPTRRRLIKRGP